MHFSLEIAEATFLNRSALLSLLTSGQVCALAAAYGGLRGVCGSGLPVSHERLLLSHRNIEEAFSHP